MTATLPSTLPPCAVNLLARPEWFSDVSVVSRARIAPANVIARVLTSPRFSQSNNIFAITLGGTIYICDEPVFDPHSPFGLALLAHEVKHVQQYERDGTLRFFVTYLQSYFAQHGYGASLDYEKQAYDFQQEVYQHLSTEFANNPGINCCQDPNGKHIANFAFAKATPARSPYMMG